MTTSPMTQVLAHDSRPSGMAGSHTDKRRPHIAVVLPRGEALRNFVYSGALAQVREHADLTLLSVVPTPELGRMLEHDLGTVVELRAHREPWIVRIQREVLDVAHGRWLWSEAARERWRLRDLEATTTVSRLKRLGKKASVYPLANRVGLAALSWTERVSSRWLRPTDDYVQLFRTIRPDLVFNASHVHSELAIQPVQAAQWLGIPTATFIFSWDNLTSQGRIIRPYDHYLVWNEHLRAQLLQMYPGVQPAQVSVTGTPQFDFHFREQFHWSRAEFCRRVGADPSRPIVLYTTGMANHMPGEPRLVERLADQLGEMREFGPPQLLVRVYPKDLTNRFEPLKRARPDILFPHIPWVASHWTPLPDDAPILTNMIRHAAVGVNVASTVSLELCMFGKPVINVGYNPEGVDPADLDYARYYQFEHYKTVVDSGAVTVARSEQEMTALLRRALAGHDDSPERGAAFLEWMFGDTLDGRSAGRVAERLVALAREEAPA
jgi:hypothetical protein